MTLKRQVKIGDMIEMIVCEEPVYGKVITEHADLFHGSPLYLIRIEDKSTTSVTEHACRILSHKEVFELRLKGEING